MTLPLQHGYPDWGRYESRATQLRFDNVLFIPSNQIDVVYANSFVGDVPFIGVRMSFNLDAAVESSFNFFADRALTVQTGSFSFSIAQDNQFAWGIPVRGAFVSQAIQSVGLGTNVTLRVFETSVGGPAQSRFNHSNRLMSSSTNFFVNAGASITATSLQTWVGRATLQISADEPDFPFAAELKELSVGGFETTIARILDPCERFTTLEVMLPPRAILLRITNNDTVQHSFQYSLYGDLGWNR